jgi:D-alanyl-D-alanine carboxypeptidase/D-alanyl-D-alanine-endopeptidase (penicillin-binding protein 4)
VTARTTIELLDYMARADTRETYDASLPEAGSARGLRRMYQTAAAGNLRAKTGTIRHVSSLSGYVRAADGERLAFSILANDVPSTWRAKRTEDAIGARIARFRRQQAPPAADGAEPGREPEQRIRIPG